ncbi:MAG: DUF4129 domain-containing protein [Pyrinomonadaceae bacterium]
MTMPDRFPFMFKPTCCQKMAAVVALFVAGFTAASASTLANYRQRVAAARDEVEKLYERIDDADTATINRAISSIERMVPVSENIDLHATSVETDNRWLVARFREFNAESGEAARVSILTEISERLLSISESVKQLEETAAASGTKDENKQRIAEILRREEYQKAQPKDKSLIQKWIEDLINWLARTFPRPSLSPETASGLGGLQVGLQILVYALVIGLLGFLIYKVAPLLTKPFGKKSKDDPSHRVILGERIEANESSTDLFSDAERLAREGDLRAAIRKGYIALLCDLSDRKIIRLAQHKTNRDYLRDLKKDEALFQDVNGLTSSFEQNWYGLRTAVQADWEQFRGRYLETVGRIKRR